MRKLRFSIGGLMVIVLAAAIGLAALKNVSRTWAGAMLLLTCGILALGVVGAICRRGAERVWWLGFSIFGWGYMALWWCSAKHPTFVLPTTRLQEVIAPWLGVPAGMGGMGGGMMSMPVFGGFGGGPAAGLDSSYLQIGHCLFALLAALLGGLLSIYFFASPDDEASERARTVAAEAGQPTRSRWLVPTIIGLVALIVASAAVTVWSGPGPRSGPGSPSR